MINFTSQLLIGAILASACHANRLSTYTTSLFDITEADGATDTTDNGSTVIDNGMATMPKVEADRQCVSVCMMDNQLPVTMAVGQNLQDI